MRIDQRFYFTNARFLADYIYYRVIDNADLKHVILVCSAVNEVDFSAFEPFEMIDGRLKVMRGELSLTAVGDPVMNRLRLSNFLSYLMGKVYLFRYDALQALAKTSKAP